MIANNKINLPGGWYLVRDDEKGPHHLCWFLSNPEGIWVANFWDGPTAGEYDVLAFVASLKGVLPC